MVRTGPNFYAYRAKNRAYIRSTHRYLHVHRWVSIVCMCKTGIKYQCINRVVCAYVHDFRKRPGCALIGACVLIRTNTAVYYDPVTGLRWIHIFSVASLQDSSYKKQNGKKQSVYTWTLGDTNIHPSEETIHLDLKRTVYKD